ncbi:hypothetical protein HYH02_011330 [Chlamydomonas schloesseri]|uniref:Uncharacterized protein n=1 Tax=Chlamydomonas schloesseri TaxID=2026947 RepID=A0A835TE03_9CHLO|nr:hypothetical protein HYH02_011330 [Chlamydomonas schloesseri]|eukprot:KAG2437070.1 hypothetical protein HYH02_011330 [Chlamydomonas schloesseri]
MPSGDSEKGHWDKLTPDIISRIASSLHENEVAGALKLVCRDVAAVLANYNKLTLGVKRRRDGHWSFYPNQAQQPWPAHAFVLYWGRPEPWRSLSLQQRERLLCLAAASGDAASLEVALAHCACELRSPTLRAAALGGSLAGCQRLLQEGCNFEVNAITDAAECGSLQVLKLVLEASGDPINAGNLSLAALGACAGGHVHVLAWLQRAHGYGPDMCDQFHAARAARGGHVGVLEHVMQSLLPQAPPPAAGAGAAPASAAAAAAATADAGEGAVEGNDRHYVRWGVLEAIAGGACPAEVLQRHLPGLWPDPAQGPSVLDKVDLLAAAVGSGTPCWAAKVDLVLGRWGRAQLLQEMSLMHGRMWDVWMAAAAHDSFMQRVRHLVAHGFSPDKDMLVQAIARGHTDALTFYMTECCNSAPDGGEGTGSDPRGGGAGGGGAGWQGVGEDPGRPGALRDWVDPLLRRGGTTPCVFPGGLAVMRLLLDSGVALTCEHLAGWRCVQDWPEEALVWAAEHLPDMVLEAEASKYRNTPQQCWTEIAGMAARGGAGPQTLRALRARGAELRMDDVVAGGSEDCIRWVAAELEAERPRALEAVDTGILACMFEAGNLAALPWLHSRPLPLPPQQHGWRPRMPSIEQVCRDLDRYTCWRRKTWVLLQQQLLRCQPPTAAGAGQPPPAAAEKQEQQGKRSSEGGAGEADGGAAAGLLPAEAGADGAAAHVWAAVRQEVGRLFAKAGEQAGESNGDGHQRRSSGYELLRYQPASSTLTRLLTEGVRDAKRAARRLSCPLGAGGQQQQAPNVLAFSETLAEGQSDLLPAVAAFRAVLSSAVDKDAELVDAYQRVAGLAGLAACELLLGLGQTEPRDAASAAAHATAALADALSTSYSLACMEAAKASAAAEQGALFAACGHPTGSSRSRSAPNTYGGGGGAGGGSAVGVLGLSLEDRRCQECVLSILGFALAALHATVRSHPEACPRQAHCLLRQLRGLPGVAAVLAPAHRSGGAGGGGGCAAQWEERGWDTSTGAELGACWRPPPGGTGPGGAFRVQLTPLAAADGCEEERPAPQLPPALDSFARFIRQVTDTLQRGLFPAGSTNPGADGEGSGSGGGRLSEVYLRACLEAAHHQVSWELDTTRGVVAVPLQAGSGGSAGALSRGGMAGRGAGGLGGGGGAWLHMGLLAEEEGGEHDAANAGSEDADWAYGHDGDDGGCVDAVSASNRDGAAAAASSSDRAAQHVPPHAAAATIVACPDSPLVVARAGSISGLGPRPAFAAPGAAFSAPATAGVTAASLSAVASSGYSSSSSSWMLGKALSVGPRGGLGGLASPSTLTSASASAGGLPIGNLAAGLRSPAAATAGAAASGGAVQPLRSFSSMRELRSPFAGGGGAAGGGGGVGVGGGGGGSLTSQRRGGLLGGSGGSGILGGGVVAAAALAARTGVSPCSSAAAGSTVVSRAGGLVGGATPVGAAAAMAAAAVSRFGAETLVAAAAANQQQSSGRSGGWAANGLARRTASWTIDGHGGGGGGGGSSLGAAALSSPRHRYAAAEVLDGNNGEGKQQQEERGGADCQGISRSSAGAALGSRQFVVQLQGTARPRQQSANGGLPQGTAGALEAAAATAASVARPQSPISPVAAASGYGPMRYGRSEPGAASSPRHVVCGADEASFGGGCKDTSAAGADDAWTAEGIPAAYRSHEGPGGRGGGGGGGGGLTLRRLPSSSGVSRSAGSGILMPASQQAVTSDSAGPGLGAVPEVPGLTQTTSFNKRNVSFAGVNGMPTIARGFNATPSGAGGTCAEVAGGSGSGTSGGGAGIQITRSSSNSIKILDHRSSGRSFSPSLSIGARSTHAAPLASHR